MTLQETNKIYKLSKTKQKNSKNRDQIWEMKNLKSIKMEKLSNLKWFFQNKKTGTESERKRSLRAAVIFSMDKLKTEAVEWGMKGEKNQTVTKPYIIIIHAPSRKEENA
jgi:hypothetical protein